MGGKGKGKGGYDDGKVMPGATKREVFFIGICGPSASGKSTITSRICTALDSPLIPVQGDWFFKSPLPCCPHRPNGCWELPTSVDSALMLTQLESIASVFVAADTIPSVTIQQTKGRHKCLDAEGLVGRSLGAGPVYIIVEGFLLFADPKLASKFLHCLWLDMDCATGTMRRFKRDGGHGDCNDANPDFVKYRKEKYGGHIYPHYEEFRPLQLSNVKGKLRARIDVNRPANVVAEEAVDVLQKAIGGAVTPAISTGSTVASFGTWFEKKQKFEWLKPTSKAGSGGHWWLAPDGMHEIRTHGGGETTESPCTVEMVGTTNFIMWHWKHVYMLDEDTGCVFVFAGKEEGISHVALSQEAEEKHIPLKEVGASAKEKRVGFVQAAEVMPLPIWRKVWHWDARVGGFDGHWKLERKEGEADYHITETKEVRGEWQTFSNKAVFVTPRACLVPKFGHVYLLDVETEIVFVWNGKGLQYSASFRD